MHHKSIQYVDVCFLDHQYWLAGELSWKEFSQEVWGYGHSQEEDSTRKNHRSCNYSCMQKVGSFLVQYILGEEEAAGVVEAAIDFLVVAAQVEPNCMDTMVELAGPT